MGTTFQLGGQGYHIAKRSIGFGTEAASDGAVDSEKSLQVGWLIGIDFLLAQTSITFIFTLVYDVCSKNYGMNPCGLPLAVHQ